MLNDNVPTDLCKDTGYTVYPKKKNPQKNVIAIICHNILYDKYLYILYYRLIIMYLNKCYLEHEHIHSLIILYSRIFFFILKNNCLDGLFL